MAFVLFPLSFVEIPIFAIFSSEIKVFVNLIIARLAPKADENRQRTSEKEIIFSLFIFMR